MTSPVMYTMLTHEQYKILESQMKTFAETTHTTAPGFYHKSIRINIGDTLMEFHGPLVKAAESTESLPRAGESLEARQRRHMADADALIEKAELAKQHVAIIEKAFVAESPRAHPSGLSVEQAAELFSLGWEFKEGSTIPETRWQKRMTGNLIAVHGDEDWWRDLANVNRKIQKDAMA